MIWIMKLHRRFLQHCKNLYILKILLKLIIVSICAKMKLSKFWHFNFRVVDSWYNIKFFVTILGLNHWNVSILLGFWQFQKVLEFQLLMNVNVPILCTISLFLWGFLRRRITNRFGIPVNFPKLLYRKLKLSWLSNIRSVDKISSFIPLIYFDVKAMKKSLW